MYSYVSEEYHGVLDLLEDIAFHGFEGRAALFSNDIVAESRRGDNALQFHCRADRLLFTAISSEFAISIGNNC